MISKFNHQWRKYRFTIDQQYCICYRAKFGFILNYFAYYASLKRKSKKKKVNIICTYNIEITNKWQKKKRDINIVNARVYIRCLIGKSGSHIDTKRHLVDRIIILHWWSNDYNLLNKEYEYIKQYYMIYI